jgi:hypothetical protein
MIRSTNCDAGVETESGIELDCMGVVLVHVIVIDLARNSRVWDFSSTITSTAALSPTIHKFANEFIPSGLSAE